jgi:hypothetical protein
MLRAVKLNAPFGNTDSGLVILGLATVTWVIRTREKCLAVRDHQLSVFNANVVDFRGHAQLLLVLW